MAHFGAGPTARPDYTRGTGVPQAGAGPLPSTRERRNAYGAKCADCGIWVEPDQGRLTQGNGGWRVSHIPPCPDKVFDQFNERENAPVVKPVTTKVSFKVPDGRYTVIWENGYKTILVSHQDEFEEFMPGRVLLSYLSGANNDRDYTRFAHVDEGGSVRIWKKHQGNEALREGVKVLLGDPKAASKAYAAESGCCGVCGRTLTTPESIERGIGPVCAEKTGF